MLFYEKFLDTVQKKIGTWIDYYPLRISLWGNNVNNQMELSFDVNDHYDTLLAHGEHIEPISNIYIIFGAINFYQLRKLVAKYQANREKKYIIHVLNGEQLELVKDSYMIHDKLSDILPVDIHYTSSSLDFDELISMILRKIGESRV